MKSVITRTILLIICAVTVAYAQDPKPVTWSLEASAAGKQGTATVSAVLEPGWHIYSLTQPAGGPAATRISVPKGQPYTLVGTVKQPQPIKKFDENFGIDTEIFEDEVTFELAFSVPSRGKKSLQADVYFQVCNESLCFPPETVSLRTPIQAAKPRHQGTKKGS